jgi:HD-GYP domain-containing protein (c-di-GMP phosphodiesterase class II)
MLAGALDLPADQRTALATAAAIYDVGMIALPDRLLRKPSKLSAREQGLLAHHVTYGVALVRGLLQSTDVLDAVAYHHERWDGQGYPHGLPGPATPLLGRIMQIADAVAAMTMQRPYRDALPWEDVVRDLRAVAGKQLDPELVALALALGEADEEQMQPLPISFGGSVPLI